MNPADGMDRLLISSVRAEDFGRWHGARLDLLDTDPAVGTIQTTTPPPMTVVFGPNQAGKSTFATLIGWMLAGPGQRRADAVAHLGGPGETLSGTMEGKIGQRPFAASGSFRPLLRGPVKPDLSVSEDSPDGTLQHDLVSWCLRLGGIDAEVIDAVYFIWGADLHGMADIGTQLKSLAMGQLRGRDPRTAIADLEESARRRGKAGARDDVSVATIDKQLAALGKEIRIAESTTERFIRAEAELTGTLQLCDDTAARLAEIRREISVIDEAMSLVRTERAVLGLQAELSMLPVVDTEWIEVIAERTRLADLHDRLTSAEADLTDDDRELSRVLELLDTSVEDLGRVRITDADIATTSRLVTEWSRTTEKLDRTRSAVEAAARTTADSFAELQHAVGLLTQVDAEAVADARPGPTGMNSISSRVIDAEAALKTCQDAARQAELADVARLSAVAEHDRVLDAWRRLKGDVDPIEWMTTVVSRQDPRPDARSASTGHDQRAGVVDATGWVALVALVATALTAASLRQWLVVGVAVAATIVTGVVQWLRSPAAGVPRTMGRGVPTDTNSTASGATTGDGPSSPDTGLDLLSLETARRLVDARETVAAATARADELDDVAARAAAHAGDVDADLRSHAASFGVHLYSPLSGVRAELDRWSDAIAANGSHSVSREAHDRAATDENALRTELAVLEGEIADHLASLGVLAVQLPTEALAMVDTYRGASAVLAKTAASRRSFETLRDQWQRFTGPVSDQIIGWSRERTLEEVADLAALELSREGLQRKIDHANAGSEPVPEGSRLAEIMRSDPTEEHLVDMERRSSEDLELTTAEWERLNQKVGALGSALDGLGSRSMTADLRSKIGALEERQQELAVEAAASLIASRVLAEVAEDYQRRNQPALIRATAEIATAVTDGWDSIQLSPAGPDDDPVLMIMQRSGESVPAVKLSTGARGLLQLSLRLALARSRLASSGVAIPLICDDPFVHFSDEWAHAGMAMLSREARDRQVIVFTCHDRSLATARDLGAHIVELDGAR